MPLLFLFSYVIVGALTYGMAQKPCAYDNMGNWVSQGYFEVRVDSCAKKAAIGWPIYWPYRFGVYVMGDSK